MQHSSLYPPGGEVTVTAARQPFHCDGRDGNRERDLLDSRRGAAFFLFGMAVFFIGIPALTR